MSRWPLIWVAVVALLTFGLARTQEPAESPKDLLDRAQRLVQEQPTAQHHLGLAEMLRVTGARTEALAELARARDAARRDGGQGSELQELLCWRLLSAGQAQVKQLGTEVERLEHTSAWRRVYRLVLAARTSERTSLLQLADDRTGALPQQFPTRPGEKAHLELLQELGWSRARAGLEVVAGREHEALHALRALDRTLTREVDFLAGNERALAADRLLRLRDGLRQHYLHAARHLVEKLFALHLLGQTQQRNDLLASARRLPYLNDRQQLAQLLDRLDEASAWTRLIQPLLTGEVALIEQPPDLTALQKNSPAELHIEAQQRRETQEGRQFEGGVRVRFGPLQMACQRLGITPPETGGALRGEGGATIQGVPGYARGISADRFTFQPATGEFNLAGAVRLQRNGGTLKLLNCILSRNGTVRQSRSLLDEFREAFDLSERLALLPGIARVYSDDELPQEVRYLLALHLLRPHLSWHAPTVPPAPTRDQLQEVEKASTRPDDPWQEAAGGEEWMLTDIPLTTRQAVRAARATWNRAHAKKLGDGLKLPPLAAFPWRLRSPEHADVTRAMTLLQGVHAKELGMRARRWLAELRRNNTVLTLDIPGAALPGKDLPLVLDARNVESVTFRLYRLQRAEELLWALGHIGSAFIYRDHGLQDRGGEKKMAWEHLGKQDSRSLHGSNRVKEPPPPQLRPENLLHQWTVRTAELSILPEAARYWRETEDDWHHEADEHYFDDDCQPFRARLEKTYRPRSPRFSSWQCDQLVQVPGKFLTQAGAYVLLAESNGQRVPVPLLVEPLSLTLRRCRDGVFVLASDGTGTKPLANARVVARGLQEAITTDTAGVAFARYFAAGDRAVVAEHQGRFAIGGFGRVFEGIYTSPADEARHWRWGGRMRAERLRRAVDVREAAVFVDRHVVAAYTDRPTYRPGQQVQFKLIVRRLRPTLAPAGQPVAFRARDFDPGVPELPDLTQPLRYGVLDPRGREVSSGTLTLNEFGTAAGKVNLNSEMPLGAYSLRIHLAGSDRIVPEVFAVQHYRRPTFEVHVKGIPEKVKVPAELDLEVASAYYFGQSVANGRVEVRLLHPERYAALATERTTLDAAGKGSLTLTLPATLESGKYFVSITVLDDSGRVVSKSVPVAIASPTFLKIGTGLAALPRFVAVNEKVTVRTAAESVAIRVETATTIVPTSKGSATLTLQRTGWHQLTAGEEKATIFAYGGDQPPELSPLARKRGEGQPGQSKRSYLEEEPAPGPRWVNLSDFAWEDSGRLSRWENPNLHLWALLDRQHVEVGGKLRVLVYVPYRQARLLFTIEGRTVLDYHLVTLPDSPTAYHVVEIPIQERYLFNFYLQGRIIAASGPRLRNQVATNHWPEAVKQLEREEEEGRDPRWCRIDVLDPRPQKGRDQLRVQVTTERPEYRPGDTVQVQLRVTDQAGAPRSAEISLGAVDESVYSFGEDRAGSLSAFFVAPPEVRRFLPKVWRSSLGQRWTEKGQAVEATVNQHKDLLQAMAKQSESLQKLENARSLPSLTAPPERRLALPLLGEMPVSTLPLARLRSDFRETATWQPQLRTGPDGVLNTSFRLPDTLTRYRLTGVALTKATEIGVGKAHISATLPLAVQLVLPRFAVEKDRLLAVGLIHNSTAQERTCAVDWEVSGAKVDGTEPPSAPEKVVVPARGNARVGLWLKLEQAGLATVTLRASSSKQADAETRTMPVRALGREREVTANLRLAPRAIPGVAGGQETRYRLPAGFVAQDLRLSLACTEMAQALDGLDYLVDYPYGCVEQTMSRFLPAVMVAHALKHTPATLSRNVTAKLPEVLHKGLTRLYGFQKSNGSWGWFDKDEGNEAMTLYVLYGLARCESVGIPVDGAVLQRGCSYLQGRLREGKLSAELTARAWHVLALAGHADGMALAAWAERALEGAHSPPARCDLALACRLAGLPELSERLWRTLRQWEPEGTDLNALLLQTQVAHGASWDDCRRTAERLLARRQGDRWEHTRSTSWALEALAQMLAYLPERTLLRRVQVWAGDKLVLTAPAAAEPRRLVYPLHLPMEKLRGQEALPLRVTVDSGEPVFLALRAVGTQRLDKLEPSGTRIKVDRQIETLEGKPLPGALSVGQVARVRLRVNLTQAEEHLIIEDRRPAGFEFADQRIEGALARNAAHVEFRDDRLCTFATRLAAGQHELVYYLRAETRGVSHLLPGCVYPMYEDKVRGETGAVRLEVR